MTLSSADRQAAGMRNDEEYLFNYYNILQQNSDRQPVEEMLAAEASGTFTYVPSVPAEPHDSTDEEQADTVCI